MKRFFLLILLSNLLGSYIYPQPAIIDTRLSFVGNTHNFPANGLGTLVVNVEAISVVGDAQIYLFENAFQIDTALINQIPAVNNVTFDNNHFPQGLFGYFYTETYNPSDGSITFRYEKSALSGYAVIPAEWTVIVTVTIEYNMTDTLSTVTWFNGLPNFTVFNQNNAQIQRDELPIPPELQNFPLPVELNSFTAIPKENAVELKWETNTEVNNFGFDVERLSPETNSAQWKKLGFVHGNGNSNSIKRYSFMDKNPTGGKTFLYRLKQIDNDGKFEYSNHIEVLLVPVRYELFQNYPNPFNPETNIKFNLPSASKVRLDVYSVTGELLKTLINEELNEGFHLVRFNAGNLSSGIYIYRIQADNFMEQRKMILVK